MHKSISKKTLMPGEMAARGRALHVVETIENRVTISLYRFEKEKYNLFGSNPLADMELLASLHLPFTNVDDVWAMVDKISNSKDPYYEMIYTELPCKNGQRDEDAVFRIVGDYYEIR